MKTNAEQNTIFNPRSLFPELTCPAEHAAFAAIWTRKVVSVGRSLAYDITQSTNETRHLSLEAQDAVAKARQLAEALHVELLRIQRNTDSEVNGKEVFWGPQPAVAAEPLGNDQPRGLGTTAGLYVCEECGFCDDYDEWIKVLLRAQTHLEPAEHEVVCPACGATDKETELTAEWVQEMVQMRNMP